MCESVLPACASVYHMDAYINSGGHKKVLDPLELGESSIRFLSFPQQSSQWAMSSEMKKPRLRDGL